MIKAAIYDLDGLMVNSEPLHDEAWDLFLASYGKKLNDIPISDRRKLLGLKVIDVCSEINKLLKLGLTPEWILNERSKISRKLLHEKLEVMPGLYESIRFFKANGIKLAIASSGIRWYIEDVLQKFKISNDFDVIVTGNDVHNGKPHPEPYLKACSLLKFDPIECVVLEDADNGVISAKKAGCYCIGVRSKHNKEQTYDGADIVIESLDYINDELLYKLN